MSAVDDLMSRIDDLEEEAFQLGLRAQRWQMAFWAVLGLAILGWIR